MASGLPAGKRLAARGYGTAYSEQEKKYSSMNELRDADISEATLEKLADADAFRTIGFDQW